MEPSNRPASKTPQNSGSAPLRLTVSTALLIVVMLCTSSCAINGYRCIPTTQGTICR